MKETLCSRCKASVERENQRYCLSCHSAYMRQYRKTHKLSEEQRKKGIIRSKVKMRVRRGKLKKLPCEICGEQKVHAHHDDYRRPYDIRWLCKYHHNEYHRINRINYNGIARN